MWWSQPRRPYALSPVSWCTCDGRWIETCWPLACLRCSWSIFTSTSILFINLMSQLRIIFYYFSMTVMMRASRPLSLTRTNANIYRFSRPVTTSFNMIWWAQSVIEHLYCRRRRRFRQAASYRLAYTSSVLYTTELYLRKLELLDRCHRNLSMTRLSETKPAPLTLHVIYYVANFCFVLFCFFLFIVIFALQTCNVCRKQHSQYTHSRFARSACALRFAGQRTES